MCWFDVDLVAKVENAVMKSRTLVEKGEEEEDGEGHRNRLVIK